MKIRDLKGKTLKVQHKQFEESNKSSSPFEVTCLTMLSKVF